MSSFSKYPSKHGTLIKLRKVHTVDKQCGFLSSSMGKRALKLRRFKVFEAAVSSSKLPCRAFIDHQPATDHTGLSLFLQILL
jgi:hypothetical protein